MAQKKPTPTPHRPEYVSPEEAAARWSVHKDSIRRLIRDGQLPAYRLNNRIIRVRLDDVDACFRPVPTSGGTR